MKTRKLFTDSQSDANSDTFFPTRLPDLKWVARIHLLDWRICRKHLTTGCVSQHWLEHCQSLENFMPDLIKLNISRPT